MDSVFAAIDDGLANSEEVRIVGFGTLGTKSRSARTGHNPRTSEVISLSPSISPTFTAGETLKEVANAGARS